MDYNAEIIVGLTFIIVLLLLMIAGLSSELKKQKQNAKRLHDSLDSALKKSQTVIENLYKR